jgi:putative flippase GtrA
MRQLVRYAAVGIATNVSGYAVYLLVTWAGMEPKVAMTSLYLMGAVASFFANRRWTFSHEGSIAAGGVRFGIAHLLGYLVNLGLLMIFVDRLGFPHQAVQAAAIVIVALLLFALFKWFVFSASHDQRGVAP